MHLRHGFWSSELAGLWVPSDKDAKKNGAMKSPEVGWQGGGGDLSHSSEHFLGKALAPLWTLWQQIPDFCCMPVYTQLFQVRKIKLNSGIQLSPFSLVDFSGGVRPLCIQLQVSNGQKDGGQLSRCKNNGLVQPPRCVGTIGKDHFPMETYVSSLGPQALVLFVVFC